MNTRSYANMENIGVELEDFESYECRFLVLNRFGVSED